MLNFEDIGDKLGAKIKDALSSEEFRSKFSEAKRSALDALEQASGQIVASVYFSAFASTAAPFLSKRPSSDGDGLSLIYDKRAHLKAFRTLLFVYEKEFGGGEGVDADSEGFDGAG